MKKIFIILSINTISTFANAETWVCKASGVLYDSPNVPVTVQGEYAETKYEAQSNAISDCALNGLLRCQLIGCKKLKN